MFAFSIQCLGMLCVWLRCQEIADNDADVGQQPVRGANVDGEALETGMAMAGDVATPACQIEDREPEGESALQWAGRHLLRNYAHRIGRSIISSECSRTTARARLRAGAEHIFLKQKGAFLAIVELVEKMAKSKAWRAMHFAEHVLYDETPLKLMVRYENDPQEHCEVAKCFSIEWGWSMLLETEKVDGAVSANMPSYEYTILRGRRSASVMAGASGTGESIYGVLRKAEAIADDHLSQVFEKCTRVAETDECKANSRAESLVVGSRGKHWMELHNFCAAHKLHAMATKTFPLAATTIRGMVHTSKHLGTAGHMLGFKQALQKLVQERLCVLLHDPRDKKAFSFQANLMKYFCPSPMHPRRCGLVLAAASFYNGNWLQRKTLQHVCPGKHCCENRDMSVTHGTYLLTRLFTTLHRGIFSKANWQQWPDTLAFFAFSDGLHGIGVDSFAEAFGQNVAQHPRSATDGNEDVLEAAEAMPEGNLSHFDEHTGLSSNADPGDARGDEDMARERAERALSLQVSTSFMKRGLWQSVYMLRVTLEGQRALMATVLESIGREWEEKQLNSVIEGRPREFRVVSLNDGRCFENYLSSVGECLLSPILWSEFAETERFRGRLCQQSLRPAAVCHQLLRVRFAGLPFLLFRLLTEPSDVENLATQILNMPMCLRDQWSKAFLDRYHSVRGLLSNGAQHEILMLADMMLNCTYTTERLHSKHLRRAKDRQGRRADLPYVALTHMGYAAPTPCPVDVAVSNVTCAAQKGGRPRKRSAESQPEQGNEGHRQRRRQRGGGGPWRAYMHEQMQGTQFTSEGVRELAASYNLLSQEQKARYVSVGHHGLGCTPCTPWAQSNDSNMWLCAT